MKFGVVVFPGSNCDQDCVHVLGTVLGQSVQNVWHQSTDLAGYDCVVLPGGFSYGDYLRAGAIARFSPVTAAVERFARADGLVIGICNGFQILVEAGMLPGALLRNDSLQFRCHPVDLRVENADTAFTRAGHPGQVLRMPIAHGEGRYVADDATLHRLRAEGGVVLRYCDPTGAVTAESNPNGSTDNIAGIVSAGGNVFGMMPHPERASEPELGGADGRLIFDSILQTLGQPVVTPAVGAAR